MSMINGNTCDLFCNLLRHKFQSHHRWQSYYVYFWVIFRTWNLHVENLCLIETEQLTADNERHICQACIIQEKQV